MNEENKNDFAETCVSEEPVDERAIDEYVYARPRIPRGARSTSAVRIGDVILFG